MNELSKQAKHPFGEYRPCDVRALIDDYPLAWVHSVAHGEASLLPLIGMFNDDGHLIELIGHFSRTNPLLSAFNDDPRATILFTGPQGYLSPSQAGRRNWGPTWNYAQVHIEAELSVEEALTPHAVDLLVRHVESGRSEPWTARELGPRYDLLMPLIIAFRARITRMKPTFKLGQTEDDPTFHALMSNLSDGDLKRWMERFNTRRSHAGDGGDN